MRFVAPNPVSSNPVTFREPTIGVQVGALENPTGASMAGKKRTAKKAAKKTTKKRAAPKKAAKKTTRKRATKKVAKKRAAPKKAAKKTTRKRTTKKRAAPKRAAKKTTRKRTTKKRAAPKRSAAKKTSRKLTPQQKAARTRKRNENNRAREEEAMSAAMAAGRPKKAAKKRTTKKAAKKGTRKMAGKKRAATKKAARKTTRKQTKKTTKKRKKGTSQAAFRKTVSSAAVSMGKRSKGRTVPKGDYVGKSGTKIRINPFLSNADLVVLGVGTGIGYGVATLADRFWLTMPVGDSKDAVTGAAAVTKFRESAVGWERLGIQAAGALLGGAGGFFLFRRGNTTVGTALVGVGAGFALKGLQLAVTGLVLPALLPKSPAADSLQSRLLPDIKEPPATSGTGGSPYRPFVGSPAGQLDGCSCSGLRRRPCAKCGKNCGGNCNREMQAKPMPTPTPGNGWPGKTPGYPEGIPGLPNGSTTPQGTPALPDGSELEGTPAFPDPDPENVIPMPRIPNGGFRRVIRRRLPTGGPRMMK